MRGPAQERQDKTTRGRASQDTRGTVSSSMHYCGGNHTTVTKVAMATIYYWRVLQRNGTNLRGYQDHLSRAVPLGEVDDLLDGDVSAHGVHEHVELVHHPETMESAVPPSASASEVAFDSIYNNNTAATGRNQVHPCQRLFRSIRRWHVDNRITLCKSRLNQP